MSYDRAIVFFRGIFAYATCQIFLWASWILPVLADTDDDDSDDYDPLPGRTPEQIDALIFNFDEVVETIILYTALFSLLAILLALAASMGLGRWVGYILLTIASLLWFSLFEQHVTGLYWIGFDISVPSLILIGIPLISAHFFFAGWYITRDSKLRIMRPTLLAATVLPLFALALNWPLGDGPIPLTIVALAGIACVSHLLTIPSFDTAPNRSLYTKRNVVVVSAALVFIAFGLFGELDEGLDVGFAIRSTFVAVVCLFAFFLVQFVIAVLRERDASVRDALRIAQREAEQARALLEAEKNYARAKETARLHTMRLATASHDIRQPIISLRATMAAVAKGQSPEVQSQLTAAFDYLDQLAKSYMETEDPPNGAIAAASGGDGREVVSAQMLCDTLERMFRKEAEAKKLAFDVNAVDRDVEVAPLVVTRILSNLLSNAIKHTDKGQITLSAKPNDQGYQFAVHNSSHIPQENLFEHGVKGDSSDGSGFGLAIVERLSKAHGLTLEWTSTAKDGTEFVLGLRA